MSDQFDVVCIGHLSEDRNIAGERSEVSTGGAIYYGGMVLLFLGLRVAVVTRLAQQDFFLLDGLKAAGADLFPVATAETSRIKNIYPDPTSDRRTCHPLGFAGPFCPEDIPEVEARLYYVGPIMPGEVDLPFLHEVAARGPLALDAQGILRKQVGNEMIIGDCPEAAEGLAIVRYLKVDDREAEVLTGERNYRRAAALLAEMGPQEVVLTHKSGVLTRVGGNTFEAPFRPQSLAGRTGRGDTCFSAYLGRRLQDDPPETATRFAAALTTLKLGRPGPFRGTVDEVYRLLETH